MREEYAGRIGELDDSILHAARQHKLCIANLVALAVVGCGLLYASLQTGLFPAWAALAVVPGVAYAGRQALQRQTRVQKLSRLRRYYETGLARLDRDWDRLDGGGDHIDGDHFYSTDLDLFGRGSMFALLCSARTQAGRSTLARWMKEPASLQEILRRRAAILELRGRRDVREMLAMAGATRLADCRLETFDEWLDKPRAQFPPWAAPAAFVLAMSTVALALLYWLAGVSFFPLLAAMSLEVILAGVLSRRVRPILESLRMPSIELPIVCELLRMLESERFSSDMLAGLAQSPSDDLHRFRRLVRLLDQRNNEMFTLPSYALLWGTQFAIAIERWRVRNGARMRGWLAAVGEFEALISLATYSHEHPHDVFPEFTGGWPIFEAEGLGHPLLEEPVCVRNDLCIGDGVRFLIVSGSNMSGKSTFLRAVGLNAVLARMGAPVRCRRLRMSMLEVGAAIRVEDSLVDGRSRFMAEMERLRRMIDAASREPLLFLIDELMIGTNSRDRRIAAEWVLRALATRGAIGLVTTHDLALTEIASCDGLRGVNVHFADSGDSRALEFDYRLRPGLLSSSNALNLVRLLGIDETVR